MKQSFLQRRAILAILTVITIAALGLSAKAQTVLSGTHTGPATVSGNFAINANTNATFTSGYTFQATTTLAMGNNSTLNWNQNGTIAGTAITSGTTSYAYLSVLTNSSLTLDSATTLTGDIYLSGTTGATIINQGAITQNTNTGYFFAPTLTNQGSIVTNAGSSLYVGYYDTGETATNAVGGTITANGASANIYLENIINQGTLTAQNGGSLFVEGTHNTTAHLGNTQIGAGGGHIYVNGTIDNSSATLSAPGGTGAVYELYNGTISNGTIAAGALTFTNSGGTLNNVSYTGGLNLAANTSVTFTGGSTTFTGTNLTLANNASLNWNQNGTLTGKTITSGTTSYGFINVGTNDSLTLGSGTTMAGDIYLSGTTGATIINQGSITQNTGTGYLYAPTVTNQGSITASAGSGLYLGYYSGETITNASGGTITANGTGANITLQNIINQGTLNAQNNGILYFQGTVNTTANLGNVVLASGGRALLQGTFDNTAATLNAPSGGAYELYGGTINNGTIGTGALTFTNYGGTVAGATLLDPVALPASTNVTLSNDTLTGNVTLGASATLYLTGTTGTFFPGANLNLGNYSTLYWNQNGTLTGKTIASGTTAGAYATINVGTGNSLTLDSATSLTGGINLYGAGTGTAIINQGAINQTSGSGYIYGATGSTFTNANGGTITASGASSLNIGYYYNQTVTNASGGTITADGAGTTVYLTNILNQGLVKAQNGGVLEFQGGSNTTASLGTPQIGTGGGHLYLNGTFDNTTATLNAPSGGAYELYGGTINNGTIGTGALTFTNYGGTVAGATLLDPVALPASTNVTLSNDTLTGNVTLGASATLYLTGTTGTFFPGANLNLGNYSTLYWNQNGTLTGKTIASGTTAGAYATINVGTGNSLTLDSATSLTGDIYLYGAGTGTAIVNQGAISQTSGSGYIYGANGSTFTNANGGTITASGASSLNIGYYYNQTVTNASGGTITADGAGTTVYLTNILNQGLVKAQNGGVLEFQGGSNTTASLGTPQIGTGGGHLYLNGTFDNTTATLNAPSGGAYELYGGTINNGTIGTGALTFTNYGGTVAGATLLDPVALPASTNVTLSNDTLTGNVTLGASATLYLTGTTGTFFPGANLNLGNYSTLYWNQNGTLTGKTIASGTTAGAYATINVGTGNSLTLDSATSLTGDIYLYGAGTGTAIVNQGAISQTSGSGYIYGANGSTFTNANGGTITASGGSSLNIGYYYNQTVTNASGGTITADGAGTTVYLTNILNQGLVKAQNGGVLEFQGGSNTTASLGTPQIGTGGGHLYLNGTFDNTAATLNAPTGGAYELYGGTINNGTIGTGALTFTNYAGTLNNVSYTGNFSLPTNASVTFAGGTNFTGANATLGNNSTLYWNQNGTLTGKTIASGTTAGAYANIDLGTNNTLTLGSTTALTGTIYLSGNTGSALVNQGTITQTSGTGYLYVPSFTNSGLLDVQGGYLYTNNNLTNGVSGAIRGAGTIGGNATITGGTISPGETTGNLTFYNSTFGVSGPTVLSVNLSGITANELIFQTPTAAVNLGSGLLSLSLNLLSAPSQGTTYSLIGLTNNYNSYAITGTFAGLPASGSGFSANYLGTPYLFTVNYGPNLISITAVPEPGTTALLGLGLTLLGVSRWRTRRNRA